MPMYEYYCADCRTKFEALRRMNQADTAIQCKNCESIKTSRVLSLFATLSSSTAGESSSAGAPASFGGGCCGGSCGCRH